MDADNLEADSAAREELERRARGATHKEFYAVLRDSACDAELRERLLLDPPTTLTDYQLTFSARIALDGRPATPRLVDHFAHSNLPEARAAAYAHPAVDPAVVRAAVATERSLHTLASLAVSPHVPKAQRDQILDKHLEGSPTIIRALASAEITSDVRTRLEPLLADTQVRSTLSKNATAPGDLLERVARHGGGSYDIWFSLMGNPATPMAAVELLASQGSMCDPVRVRNVLRSGSPGHAALAWWHRHADEIRENELFSARGTADLITVLAIDALCQRTGVMPDNDQAITFLLDKDWWEFTEDSPAVRVAMRIHRN